MSAPLATSARLLGAAAALVALLPGSVFPSARAQDLVGCQLVEGTLQCVPGITAAPQQQIRILDSQIRADQALEGAVEQQISGLRQLLLVGRARQGQLLQASLEADALAGVPPSAFHWYRRSAGGSSWVLIEGASGPAYRLSPDDVGQQVMVVLALPAAAGSQRSASAPIGPVSAP